MHRAYIRVCSCPSSDSGLGQAARPWLPGFRLANYHRQVGGEIRGVAKDDVAVAGVTAKVSRQSDGTVIEQGAATYYRPYWRYVATAAPPVAPEALDIEVSATDLPGTWPPIRWH